jgi:hypothetical protein
MSILNNELVDWKNNLMITKIFNSIDVKHQIEIKIDYIGECAWFNINKLDYESCKTFLIVLKEVMEFLNSNNIKIIKQYVYEEDLNFFEKSSHSDIGNRKFIISTDIIHFLSELVNALGINKL